MEDMCRKDTIKSIKSELESERSCNKCSKYKTYKCPHERNTYVNTYMCLDKPNKPYFTPILKKVKTEKKSKNRKYNVVFCPLCGVRAYIITSVHLETCHGITLFDFIKLDKSYIGLTALKGNKIPKEIDTEKELDPEKEKELAKKRSYSNKYYAKNIEKMREKKREQAQLMRDRKKAQHDERSEQLKLLTPKYKIGDEIKWSYYNREHKGIVEDYDRDFYLVSNINCLVDGNWIPKEGIKLIRW